MKDPKRIFIKESITFLGASKSRMHYYLYEILPEGHAYRGTFGSLPEAMSEALPVANGADFVLEYEGEASK